MSKSLNDVCNELPDLETSLREACDWLVDVAQIKTEMIEPESDSRHMQHEYWRGSFRGEYNVAERKWDVFCPVWHGGQAVKSLCQAWQVTREDRYLEAAKLGGEFLLRNRITEGPDAGLILAYEDLPDKTCSSAILETLDGLFLLTDTTGDDRYETAAIAAAQWCRDNVWVRGEGLLRDWFDPKTREFFTVPHTGRKDVPGRPLVDDAVWLTAARRGGDPSLRDVFYEVLERLLRDERPAGNWVDYGPCRRDSGEIHPRHAYWWGRPMLEAWRDTKEQKWMDAAQRSGQWYVKAQRLDGGLLRFTDLDFNTACFGHATSGIACAAIMWIELFQETGDFIWLEPLQKAMSYCRMMQFINPEDPNLQGCILEKVLPPDGTDRNPYYIRELGTIFYAQAAAQLIAAARTDG
ncbi:MAG: hypothetical protein CMJ18_14575 [Phycisphaeraceae bacterium]|nr:hypothetical protein [Phycisphaeraceae bacterium]